MARRHQTEEQPAKQAAAQPSGTDPHSPACTACAALRPAGVNKTSVTHRRRREYGEVLYCHCGYCGNTWAYTPHYIGRPR